jgi:hypothetical protein
MYVDGCRYNARLNTETGGSKRLSYTGLPRVNSKPSPSGHTEGNCRSGQTLKKPKYLSACDREERGCGEGSVCMSE